MLYLPIKMNFPVPCQETIALVYIRNLTVCVVSVFMSPETAITNPWRNVFRERKIAMVAVDEAHFILEWLVP